jgi:cell division protein FtsW (lipid II flippase)
MQKEKGPVKKDKFLPTTLLIIGIILIIGGSRVGYYIGLGYIGVLGGYLIGLALIITAIVFYVKKPDKKVYKENSAPKEMKIQYIFYSVGVIFIFAAVWYFAREFIDDLPDVIKLLILVVAVVVAFIIAEFLRGADK